jgi:Fe-S-cluster containining protein
VASGLSRARFRCTGCGNCCRGLRVPVTDADLARLTAATGEPAERLVAWLAPGEVDMTGEPSSFAVLDVGRRLMVLAHDGGACRLLEGDRCRAHAARPSACRLYPLEASFGRRGGVRRLRLLARGVDCRYELDGEPARDELARTHATARAELAAYQARIARWNRDQKRRQRLLRRPLGAAELCAWLERGA